VPENGGEGGFLAQSSSSLGSAGVVWFQGINKELNPENHIIYIKNINYHIQKKYYI
jgi:hypothetical protein